MAGETPTPTPERAEQLQLDLKNPPENQRVEDAQRAAGLRPVVRHVRGGEFIKPDKEPLPPIK